MDKLVSRPKNEDVGKPLRDKRVPVMMSEDEWTALNAASQKAGVGLSTYLRQSALKATKDA